MVENVLQRELTEVVVRHPVPTLGGVVRDVLIVRLPRSGMSAREADAWARERVPAGTVVEIR